jgi:hypothetical protein
MYIIIIWIRSEGQNSNPGPEPEKEFLDMSLDKRLESFAPLLLANFTENHTGTLLCFKTPYKKVHKTKKLSLFMKSIL